MYHVPDSIVLCGCAGEGVASVQAWFIERQAALAIG